MAKRFKDPIYGYIEIEEDIVDRIIDSASFQRLRDIIQTSYTPLYASAMHNRFVHSLGVFYLAGLALDSILETIPMDINIDRCSIIFKYACLLHDVGHAPFSHAGEYFYLDANSSRDELHQEILDLINDKDTKLKKEIDTNTNYNAAPHELMSAIVGLRQFSDLFISSEEREFFIRCITGYKYSEGCDCKRSILNCVISLLSSDVIDVDRLDYLIRDAFTSGFNTVVIDYKRLLGSLTVYLDNETGLYSIAYRKSAISVIENAVYAHDAERKWIQSHPVVLYESFLIKYGIEKLIAAYPDKGLFSYNALTPSGIQLEEKLRIRLLSDSDVVFLMKHLPEDNLINEYFTRKDRMHSLWKSESEYKSIFNLGFNGNTCEIMETEFDLLARYINSVTGSQVINQAATEQIELDIGKNEAIVEKESNEEIKRLTREQINIKKRHLLWVKELEKFALNQKIDFDFVIIKADQFNSSFGKQGFEKIKVLFDNTSKPCFFKDVTNVFSAVKSERSKFFYLYYHRTDRSKKVNVRAFAIELNKFLADEVYS